MRRVSAANRSAREREENPLAVRRQRSSVAYSAWQPRHIQTSVSAVFIDMCENPQQFFSLFSISFMSEWYPHAPNR